MTPQTEAELAEAIRAANGPLELTGAGTKRAIGRPAPEATLLDLTGFSGITLYEPDELVLSAGAATPRADAEAALAKAGQSFAFEPPDLSRLLASGDAGTLGGMLSCNLAGPRRIKAGAARDHILGVTGVSGRGEIFKAGSRVVKNVTGYDRPKLMANSWGTLAALTSVTFKVLPAAETEATVALHGLDDAAAIHAMSAAMQSSCEVSGAAHLPASLGDAARTLLRLEGIPVSIAYRRDKLVSILKSFGTAEVLEAAASRAQWIAVRDVHPLCDAPERAVWRISTTPSQGAALLARLPQARGYYDWAGGLIWLDHAIGEDAGAQAIRSALTTGHATLIRAPEAVRARVPVFQPQPPALAALSQRVKNAFDPRGVLNPGRMG